MQVLYFTEHCLVVQGTQVYNAKKGAFVDLGILDVLQIFGRAGRPQFDSYGEGTIITSHDKLAHYLSLLTRQQPIESQLVGSLTDNLNAEVGWRLGSLTQNTAAVKSYGVVPAFPAPFHPRSPSAQSATLRKPCSG